jgi:hypothetical protein
MKLDSESQRQELLAVCHSAGLTGTFDQLQQAMTSVANLIQTIAKAELEPPSIVKTETTKE